MPSSVSHLRWIASAALSFVVASTVACGGGAPPSAPEAPAAAPAPAEAATEAHALTVAGGVVRGVSVGRNFACGLGSAGELFCWGSNAFGQLGTGATADRSDAPQRVTAIAGAWQEVSAGGGHACGLRGGALYCWGQNTRGQLGDGTTTARAVPTRVGARSDWTAIDVGLEHTCGVAGDSLFCWGNGTNGRLGRGSNADATTPAQVAGAWTSVSVGDAHACAVASGGAVACWGFNGAGQLGDGTNTERNAPVTLAGFTVGAGDVLSAGGNHTCAVRPDATMWCWGFNTQGQVGDASTTSRTAPTLVGTQNDWAAVAAGDEHTCGLSQTGQARCWGSNRFGQGGLGTTSFAVRPVPLSSSSGWTELSAGSGTCVANGSRVNCWGPNRSGELGIGQSSRRALAQLSARGIVGWRSFALGQGHACGVLADGSLWCAGLNANGQLGIGAYATTQAYARVGTANDWQSVTAGLFHTCALRTSGALYCWGLNVSGQLGDGTAAQRTAPVQVPGTWTQVSAGHRHTCGLRTNGALYCWGQNADGRLGDGSTTSRATPTLVGTGYTAVAAGGAHTCAIDQNRAVFCMGANEFGQLGNGSQAPARAPTAGPTGYTSLTAGQNHTCGVATNGELHCWGSNAFGQVTNLAGNAVTPVIVPGGTGWTQGSANGSHTCAIRAGQVRCFGANASGQLGDGTYVQRGSPVTVPNIAGTPTLVASGPIATCVVAGPAGAGSLYCFGDNPDGAFGDNTAWVTSSVEDVCIGNQGPCVASAQCTNGLAAVACTCNPGYTGDGRVGGTGCVDQNECATNNGGCAANAICTNTVGSRTCACGPGFNGDGFTCTDINECVLANGGCDANATCTNTPGSRTCTCNEFFVGNGTSCSFADVCSQNNGGCSANATCSNTFPGRSCACRPGFVGDGVSCVDVNECATANGGCGNNATCTNLPGSYQCACARGFVGDGYTCVDVNECATNNGGCDRNATCSNNVGGFSCACNLDYAGNGFSCQSTATCTDGRQNGNELGIDCGGSCTLPCPIANRIQQVVMGNEFSCALLSDGSVRCMGYNANGQLGDGTTENRWEHTPVGLPVNTIVTQLAAGQNHTCALSSVGEVFCWGYNQFGQLGNGNNTAVVAPVRANVPTSAVQLAAGFNHTCAALADGSVRCWGYNAYGQVGNGTTNGSTGVYTPVTVANVTGTTRIAAGSLHTCALASNGTARCWGYNINGQLGDGTVVQRNTATLVNTTFRFDDVATGDDHTCARLLDGRVACWGQNSNGQLGDGTTNVRTQPRLVSGVQNARRVTTRAYHTCAYLEDNTAVCWGNNGNGQLGDGTTTRRTTPVSVARYGTTLTSLLGVTAGWNSSCVIRNDGTLWCWGYNGYGALGDRTTLARTAPEPVVGLPCGGGGTSTDHCAVCVPTTCQAAGVTAGTIADGCGGSLSCGLGAEQTIDAGSNHYCTVTAQGGINCWGANGNGQLGDGTTAARTSPVAVSGLATRAVGVSGGLLHTCALLQDGRVQCWGYNVYGQLGDGTATQRTVPVLVGGLPAAATSLSAGAYHTCATLVNGDAYCWGYNASGQLGDGTATNRLTATRVRDLRARVSEIAAGNAHSCVVYANGQGACWGNGAALGSGGTASNVPRTLPDLFGLAQIVTSDNEAWSCARTTTGRVFCWGSAGTSLGAGFTTSNRPIEVTGVEGSVDLSLHGGHACVVLADGGMRCWGENNNGECGDGTTTARTTPVSPRVYGTPLMGVARVATGLNSTCVQRRDGQLQCWGFSGNGELGNGATTQQLTPGLVAGSACAGGNVGSLCLACNPTSCQLQGLNAGTLADGCGGTLTCTGASPVSPAPPATTTELHVGIRHTCLRNSDGTLRCWGADDTGQLGDGPPSAFSRFEPVTVQSLAAVSSYSVGYLHSCAVNDGAVWCWGANSYGQLGNGGTTDSPTPVRVAGIGGTNQPRAIQVSAGGNHSCALIDNGTVRCWGYNYYGQLGDGTTSGAAARPNATFVAGLSGVTDVAAGNVHTCAITQGGAVYCWGYNATGQLGDGTIIDRPQPQLVIASGAVDVEASTFSNNFTCALMQDRTVRCWGENAYGNLGDGTTQTQTAPVQVVDLTQVVQLSVGAFNTCARLADGTARCWGYNGGGALGDNTTTNRTTPRTVGSLGTPLTNIVDISIGGYHTCARVSDGRVLCWGDNGQGQLGDQTNLDDRRPSDVYAVPCGGSGTSNACGACRPTTCAAQGMTSGSIGDGCGGVLQCGAVGVATLGGGESHWCELANGGVRCWGSNAYGQLGDGTTTARTTPVTPTGLGSGVAQLAVGPIHTCALMADGRVQCWGYNFEGQLGDGRSGASTNRTAPNVVPGLSAPGVRVVQVSAARYHTCALLSNGRVRCWGDNGNQQLGDGSSTNRLAPIEVVELSRAVQIAAGNVATCALLENGRVTCWGNNGNGQLGNGTASANRPRFVAGVEDATQVSLAAQTNYGCATLRSGQVTCWGANPYGNLGDGTTTQRTTPVRVQGVSAAIAVSTASNHACATLRDRTVRCWGLNDNFELGDMTATQRATAVSAGAYGDPLGGVVEVVAGTNSTCVRMASGAVQCWGYNASGELGDGTTTQRITPGMLSGYTCPTGLIGTSCQACTPLSNACASFGVTDGVAPDGCGGQITCGAGTVTSTAGSRVVQLATGTNAFCARLDNGRVECWGNNSNGQLGDGTTTQRWSPVEAVGVTNAVDVSVGGNHACAVQSDGSIWCWGYNFYGQLGLGHTENQTTPQRLPAFGAGYAQGFAVQVTAGQNHTCARLSDGSIRCWGYNYYGQLGDGTTNGNGSRPNPTLVPLADVIDIDAGAIQTCALTSNGAAWCWGYNGAYNLGDGTTVDRSTPVAVRASGTQLTGAVEIDVSSDQYFACARMATGGVRCWGVNSWGNLGDGSTTQRAISVPVLDVTNAAQLSVGNAHVCVRSTSSTIQCWGINDNNELGDGTTTNRPTPVNARVFGNLIVDARAVIAGADQTCTIRSDGRVACWGFNGSGMLGDGTTISRQNADLVAGLPCASGGTTNTCSSCVPATCTSTNANGALADGCGGTVYCGDMSYDTIRGGSNHTCERTAAGTLRCWGVNTNAQLGDGTLVNRTAPITVSGLGGSVRQFATGQYHTCAVNMVGELFCWGYNAFGQVGDGTTTQRTTPVRVPGFGAQYRALEVTVGANHTCVLGQDRTVRCFGYNPNGELGNGLTLNGATATIQRVLELDRVVQLSASSNNTCALQDSGRVFCWGAGSSGQNGNGATGSTVPRAVVGLGDVVELRSAPEASMQCARRRDGTVWCWGQNNVGQLGDGTTTQRNVPTQVSGLGDAAQLAIGPNHACAVRGDRTVWCWGQNNNHELGDGTTTQRTTPVQPTAYGTPIVGVTEVSVSSDHTCVRMASGIVQCWGYNAFGNLADGTTTQRPHPVTISTYACGGVLIGSFCSDCQPLTCAQAGVTNGVVSNGCGGTLSCGSGGTTPRVPPATDTLELATGDNFTCARMNNGRVRCWGSGTSGQLGGTSTFDSLEPVDVAGVEDAAQVVAGVRFACARTTSGAVLCWGNDQYGQLGDGQATNAAFPARMVLGLDGTRDRAVEIAAGGYHACARIDDGTVRCWGFNSTGALGDGTTASRGTPVTVAGLRSVTSLSAGYGFTCVVSNGGVVCWGQNGNYQLGDGSSIERTTPTESGSLPTGVSRVVAAFNGYYACAIMNDGQVQCWGQNNNGQLGDDSTNDRSSAAPVVGLSDVTQLSLGTYHACARILDGTVRCWGQNNNFELADGTTTQRRVPTVTQVNADTLRNVRSVLAGSDNTCAIFTNGQVGCWGYGLQGQLGNQSANQERSVAMTYAMPCGGDGTSEACSTSCVPRTCGPRGTQAGIIADGCGGTLYCGAPTQHSLSAGNAFWCERTGAGAARCWGNNTYGQLGNGNTTASSSPVTPTGLSSGVVSIAAGTYHACATTTDGAVWCWGYNFYGQVGDGTAGASTNRSTPQRVPGFGTALRAVSVTAGQNHSCALVQDGTVRCWGYNANNELGDGTNSSWNWPRPVADLTGVVEVQAGLNFTCALTENGRTFCWGANSSGQLGFDNTRAGNGVPRAVIGLEDAVELDVSDENAFTCARRRDGSVWCWGWNAYGNLGDGSTTQRNAPVQVVGVANATALTVAANHACASTAERGLMCWGLNDNWELGDASTQTRTTAVPAGAHGTPLFGVAEVVAGANSTCVRMTTGLVQCWGFNGNGELGDGTTTSRAWAQPLVGGTCGADLVSGTCFQCAPTSCAAAGVTQGAIADGCGRTLFCGVPPTTQPQPATNTLQVVLGASHACSLTDDGLVECWGANGNGQLGDGTTFARLQPVTVAGLSGVVQLAAGGNFTCALTSGGTVHCWGFNTYGELGNGTTEGSSRPTRVVGFGAGDRAVQITAGLNHACARTSAGLMRCWGYNFYGQLGDGTTNGNGARPYPTTVGGLFPVTDVAAGALNTCAVVGNNTTWCWGYNGTGSVGDNTIIDRSTPTQVLEGATALVGVVDVEAGLANYNACARLATGAVRCWGTNGAGQIGDGTTTQRNVATAVQNLTTATQLSMSGAHTCARLSSGAVQCWGANGSGELGDQTTTARSVPTSARRAGAAIADARVVAASGGVTCIVNNAGGVECWGANGSGQLGDLGTTSRNTPAAVVGLPCGNTGMSNACGTCRPTSCFEQGVSGGFIADGCGGQLYCGDPSPSRLSASDNASCIVTTAGGVQCWGIGTNGQLGNNTTTNSNRPVVVTGLTNARTVSGGPLSGCALTNDGAVWCWGYNAFGQLGDNSSTARLTPVRVQGFGPSAPALAIATGGNTACAVTWDRRLACWGYDNAGQLGRGFVSGTGANPRPEAVRELTRVVDVAVSNNTVCAARDNGTVWCFGLAGSGQHGNGGMGDSAVPRQVANVQNAINVEGARGGDSFCAIRADGTVACWGTNASGQLGDGSTTLRNTPVAVSGLTGASHLAIGDNHACAALTSGAMSCWGNNGSSKLGDGTTTQRNTPVAVLASPGVPIAGVLDVATQASTSCALQANGNVSCWGLGTSGQIGDGQSLSRTTPTRVLGF